MRSTMILVVLATVVASSGVALAADPPGLVNYQGVLRDDDDKPLDGYYDMVFRFYDDADPADPENEIFVDEHLGTGSGEVQVTAGLFDVVLGSGEFRDGNGTGDHPTLYHVFAFHEPVYLEVQIGADGAPGTEVLLPRMRVVSAPYAVNSVLLGGLAPDQFINTSSEEQEKSGLLRVLGGVDLGYGAHDDLTAFDAATLTGGPTVYADVLHNHTSVGNADTVDSKHAWEFAEAAHGHSGSDISGPVSEATNADTLDTYDSAYFLNTSTATQSKAGPLIVDAAGAGSTGLEAVGDTIGGFFSNMAGTGSANVAKGNRGIEGMGEEAGGFFEDLDASGHAWVGYGHLGISGSGSTAGGFFEDFEDSGFAWIGYGDRGIQSGGTEAGGYFFDSNDSGHAFVGYLDEGISAYGDVQGGYFEDNQGTSNAHIAYGGRGVEAFGQEAGGYFKDSNGPGEAYVGYSDASGDSYGVWAAGGVSGGYFQAKYDSGTYAYLGFKDGSDGFGVKARGSSSGGNFTDDSGSLAILARDDVGVLGRSATLGGRFYTANNDAEASVGYRTVSGQAYGIWAQGDTAGGYFEDKTESGHAWIGSLDEGISAHGDVQGGYFERDGFSNYTHVAYETHKVQGPGSNSFVQNHPFETDRVLVYSSPEGDEVATYTRGTGRLLGGEARVPLGETFAWVTNPDIGLTAHVTSRSSDAVVYVESVSTEELVVRNVTGFRDEAVFDYIVHGLRIGFEEVSIVQEKRLEARIPSMSDHRQRYEQHPELRTFNALERFKGMESGIRGIDSAQLDFSRATALKAAIEEYDPNVHGRIVRPHMGDAPADGGPEEPASRPEETGSESAAGPGSELGRTRNVLADRHETIEETTEPTASAFAVSEPVEPGDLLVLDPDRPGQLRRADTAADPNVFGIAAAEPKEMDGQLRVEMVDSLYAVVKADASYGVILAGDLLSSSPTPGHVMVAVSPAPGEVVGKAAEPLESGTRRIRVLVMPR